ncbi:tRNA lysidine(34) synthetase TilS [uncultured Agitococcus sp.]|uniref:tRNA lysidine(34) synthetase TilS n=1 Tax=uncultured Agitococcus sp. TaxID=1506599 RepID=UPI00260A6C28|nr:tRNA lysidine(34) synthetase TilS [uncultured Agitococcus sp.]
MLSTVTKFLTQHLNPNIQRLVIAYSGGVDSHVLLDMVVQVQQLHQRPIKIIHVHHGLSQYANDWANHVEQVAQAYNVDYVIKRVSVNQQQASLEDAARQARYQAINQELVIGDVLLLAHHQQDQAETFLLRLMRGSGVTGLAAMKDSNVVPFNRLTIPAWRPLLTVNKSQILAYAQQRQLNWIEDDSNTDERLNRNYLRHQVISTLQQRWPQTVERVSAASQRLQEAEQLLQDLAEMDYQQVKDQANSLNITRLAQLSDARRHNVLRYWLQQLGFNLPDYQQLAKLWTEVCLAKEDAQPMYYWPHVEVRRYRQQLFAMSPLTNFNRDEQKWINKQQAIQLATGELIEPQQIQALIKAEYWQTGQISIAYRQGGEKIRPVGRQHHHDLKKLLQAEGVPTWQRERIPLIYINQQLAIVWGYWVAAEFAN